MDYFKLSAKKLWIPAAALITCVPGLALLVAGFDTIHVGLYTAIAVCLLLSTWSAAINWLTEYYRKKYIASVRGRQDELVEDVLSYVLANPKRRHVIVYRKTVSRIALEAQIPKGVSVTYWPLSLALSGWVNKEESTTLTCTSVIREITQYIQLCGRLRGQDHSCRVRGYFPVSDLDAHIHEGLFARGAKHHYYNTTKE